MVIYSANFGDKDKLKTPLVDSSWNKHLKFVYFTDQDFADPVWDIRISNPSGDARRIARWYKLHSHKLFPGEETIWVDGNILIVNDPTQFSSIYNHMMVQEHPYRYDLYEEAEFCGRKKKGEKEDIARQIKFYEEQGHPQLFGLCTSRVLFRKPTNKVELLNTMWWEEIEKFSSRDQISLPYILWKHNIPFKTVDEEELKVFFYKRGGHKIRGTREI